MKNECCPSPILIAAHRGLRGGNIVENTLPAFEAAIRHGADIVEIDIRKTKDQEMILFHDPSPLRLLGLPGQVSDYTLAELRIRPLLNAIGEPSSCYVNTLDELLCALQGRCKINFDQCWGFLDEVYDAIEAKGMAEQALLKGRVPYHAAMEWMRNRNWKPTFIPVIACADDIAQFEALPREMNVPLVEVFFHHDEDPMISAVFVEQLHARGIGLWVNALDLGNGFDLAAGHTDTVSVTGNPELGWGWLAEHGVSVIQTDWPTELRAYLDSRE